MEWPEATADLVRRLESHSKLLSGGVPIFIAVTPSGLNIVKPQSEHGHDRVVEINQGSSKQPGVPNAALAPVYDV
jgi:hypothetical protein